MKITHTVNDTPSSEPVPKFQITLNLEDEEEVRIYLDALLLNAALCDISEKLRSYCKYGLPENIKTPEEAIEHVREIFHGSYAK